MHLYAKYLALLSSAVLAAAAAVFALIRNG